MWYAEIWRITVAGQAGQKSSWDFMATNSWAWWCAPVISTMAVM
jgi:hypothetical protein